MSDAVIWHDLECGGYQQDLALWLELATLHAGAPEDLILDVGAGTGRVSLALARAGHRVVALDYDPELLGELETRIGPLRVRTQAADARDFDIDGEPFSLCAVPMQTLQLLGGVAGWDGFMQSAVRHLTATGTVAVAIADTDDFEEFEWHDGDAFPLPDIVETGGCVYSSQPTAVRRKGNQFVLERRREVIDPSGARRESQDRIALDIVSVRDVEEAGLRAGLKPLGVRDILPTGEHIGSQVVLLGR